MDEKSERSDALLAAARALFSSRGYASTTVEAITAAAGLSPAAFYHYFSGKLEAYRVLTARGADLLEALIGEALGSGGLDPEAELRAVALAYLRFFREHRDYYDIVAVLHLGQAEFFADLDMVPLLEAKAMSLLRRIEAILERGVREGRFKSVDTWRTAVALWGMMDGICMLEVKGSIGFVGETLEPILGSMLDMTLVGLTTGE